MGLIKNKLEKKVIPDLLYIYFHCTTSEIVVQEERKNIVCGTGIEVIFTGAADKTKAGKTAIFKH